MLLTSATHIRALMLACVPPRDQDQKSPGEDDSALVSLVIPKMGKVIPDLEDMEDLEYIYMILPPHIFPWFSRGAFPICAIQNTLVDGLIGGSTYRFTGD